MFILWFFTWQKNTPIPCCCQSQTWCTVAEYLEEKHFLFFFSFIFSFYKICQKKIWIVWLSEMQTIITAFVSINIFFICVLNVENKHLNWFILWIAEKYWIYHMLKVETTELYWLLSCHPKTQPTCWVLPPAMTHAALWAQTVLFLPVILFLFSVCLRVNMQRSAPWPC